MFDFFRYEPEGGYALRLTQKFIFLKYVTGQGFLCSRLFWFTITGTSWNKTSDNDVFLKTTQAIFFPGYGSVDKDTSSFHK